MNTMRALVALTCILACLVTTIRAANINVAVIQGLVTAAADNTEIFLSAGDTYINCGTGILANPGSSGITINGNGATIDCALADNTRSGFLLLNNNQGWVIRDLTMRQGNHAGSEGGCSLIDGGSTITFSTDTVMEDNIADLGGAVLVRNQGSVVTVESNTILRRNTATNSGGGIFSDATIDIKDDAVITGNSATSSAGGGIHVGSFSESAIVRGSVRIMNNGAGVLGGGISAFGSMKISGHVVISGNSATGQFGSGGGIFLGSGTICGNVRIENNDVTGEFGDGGGVSSDGFLEIKDDVLIAHNSASGESGVGGGVSFLGSGTICGRVHILHNSASGTFGAAGGVFAVGLTDIKDDVLIGYNSAGEAGGGVFLVDFSFLRGRVRILDNQSVFGGGVAVSLNPDTNTTFTENVQISGNTGSQGGGCIAFGPGVLSITGSVSIFDNLSVGQGGGIEAQSRTTVVISGKVTVHGNNATTRGGGVVCWFGATFRASGDALISGNTAPQGGGIQLFIRRNNPNPATPAVVILEGNAQVIGNTAINVTTGNPIIRGGGVYVENRNTLDHRPNARICFNVLDDVFVEIDGTYLINNVTNGPLNEFQICVQKLSQSKASSVIIGLAVLAFLAVCCIVVFPARNPASGGARASERLRHQNRA